MNKMIDNSLSKDNDITENLFLSYLEYSLLMGYSEQEWANFEHDLKYIYRFSSDSKIIKELHDKSSSVSYLLNKGSILYRARIYSKNPYDKLYPSFGEESLDLYKSQLINYLLSPSNSFPIAKAEKEIYKKWKKQLFKGYNADDSGAPPADKSCSGRANPKYIRYLYVCEDEITPIYEIRPIIGQYVNVAKFETKHDLKIYDLTKRFETEIEELDMKVPSLFNSIGYHFSIPCNGTSFEYLPTQFLSEEIRKMGFDGLRFESSLKKNGMNIVIFNPNDCEALSSDIKQVDSIDLSIRYADIYNIDNPIKGQN